MNPVSFDDGNLLLSDLTFSFPAGAQGRIHTTIGGSLTKLIGVGDFIGGKRVVNIAVGPQSLGGKAVAFAAQFQTPFGGSTGDAAIFIATPVAGSGAGVPLLPDPGTGMGNPFGFTFNLGTSGLGITNPIFIDPLVAIGYEYAIGAGDPDFKSVLLPTGIGDNLYDLFLFDGTNFVDSGDLTGGVPHTFGSGVRRFRILGIEASAGLDPTNPTAFVTGLTFVSGGQAVTVTMTPITFDTTPPQPPPIGVPEPASILLFGAGLAALAALARRRR